MAENNVKATIIPPSSGIQSKKNTAIFRLYYIHRNYMVHEGVMINQRIQRMLLTQAFLLTAAGTFITKYVDALEKFLPQANVRQSIHALLPAAVPVLGYTIFLILVCFAGSFMASMALKGLRAANLAEDKLLENWNKAVATDDWVALGLPGIRGAGSEKIHRDGNLPALKIAHCFIWIWLALLILLLGFLPTIWYAYLRS